MSIELRRVESDDDIDAFLGLRHAIDPEHMPSRLSYVEHLKAPGRVDLLASLGGELAGCAFVEPHSENVEGPVAWVSVRVLRERRRRGLGTRLFREVSVLARADGRDALIMAVRHDDDDSLSYLGKRGFAEALRMRDSMLELDGLETRVDTPEGIELVTLAPELEPQLYEAAVEIARDIPAAQGTFEVGGFEQWHRDQLPANTLAECSFVALQGDEVAGYAFLVDDGDGVGLHAMTGVRPAWRRRGVALALKAAQIRAAQARGMRLLRTSNAIENPMLRVNELLGFRRDVDWLHLRGPLLDQGW